MLLRDEMIDIVLTRLMNYRLLNSNNLGLILIVNTRAALIVSNSCCCK